MQEGTYIETFSVIFDVDEKCYAMIIDSDPNIQENGVFDGSDLEWNISVNKKDIPKEPGVYDCIVSATHVKYWTECGYEYDCHTEIKDIKKI